MASELPIDPMSPALDQLFGLIMLVVLAGFGYALGSFLWRSLRNLRQPVITRRARVVGGRREVSGPRGGPGEALTISCYLTFAFEDGSRAEFLVPPEVHAALAEGQVGSLHTQGTWFRGFDRELPSAADLS
ncbi:MAG: DUF2500 family protein [Bacillota bacterium]